MKRLLKEIRIKLTAVLMAVIIVITSFVMPVSAVGELDLDNFTSNVMWYSWRYGLISSFTPTIISSLPGGIGQILLNGANLVKNLPTSAAFNEWFQSTFGSEVVKIDGVYQVNPQYNFDSDDDYKYALVNAKVMQKLNAEGYFNSENYTYDVRHNLIISNNQNARIERIGLESILEVFFPEYEIVETEYGGFIAVDGTHVQIGNYVFPTRDLSPYTQLELYSKTTNSGAFNGYVILPYFVDNNGDVCILSGQTSTPFYPGSLNASYFGIPICSSYANINYNGTNFWLSNSFVNSINFSFPDTGFAFQISSLPGYILEFVINSSDIFFISNKFLNTRTLQPVTKNDINGLRFIECPASFYSDSGLIFPIHVSNTLNSQTPFLPDYVDKDLLPIPKGGVTDVLDKAKDEEIIGDDPVITMDDDGKVYVDDIPFEDIEDLLAGGEEGGGDLPPPDGGGWLYSFWQGLIRAVLKISTTLNNFITSFTIGVSNIVNAIQNIGVDSGGSGGGGGSDGSGGIFRAIVNAISNGVSNIVTTLGNLLMQVLDFVIALVIPEDLDLANTFGEMFETIFSHFAVVTTMHDFEISLWDMIKDMSPSGDGSPPAAVESSPSLPSQFSTQTFSAPAPASALSSSSSSSIPALFSSTTRSFSYGVTLSGAPVIHFSLLGADLKIDLSFMDSFIWMFHALIICYAYFRFSRRLIPRLTALLNGSSAVPVTDDDQTFVTETSDHTTTTGHTDFGTITYRKFTSNRKRLR